MVNTEAAGLGLPNLLDPKDREDFRASATSLPSKSKRKISRREALGVIGGSFAGLSAILLGLSSSARTRESEGKIAHVESTYLPDSLIPGENLITDPLFADLVNDQSEGKVSPRGWTRVGSYENAEFAISQGQDGMNALRIIRSYSKDDSNGVGRWRGEVIDVAALDKDGANRFLLHFSYKVEKGDEALVGPVVSFDINKKQGTRAFSAIDDFTTQEIPNGDGWRYAYKILDVASDTATLTPNLSFAETSQQGMDASLLFSRFYFGKMVSSLRGNQDSQIDPTNKSGRA